MTNPKNKKKFVSNSGKYEIQKKYVVDRIARDRRIAFKHFSAGAKSNY